MADPHFILIVVGLTLLFLGFIAADKGSGFMPGSGYKEEAFWGKVAMTLDIIGFACIASVAFF